MPPDVEWSSEKADDEPMSTRFARWRHNQVLLTLLTVAALLVAVAVISGTVLFFQSRVNIREEKRTSNI
ncbi:hypothetical protein JTE90_005557 [Oedothorax gibbosus]|uniref:Uncharacterized protein n=1 Tax=Oedothorax gibbosus TaxID=931172 RepID=A0AAV6VB59_9ARAC|nr:hypothetical protein JTE90_005557 [Oedothorax gibbosus]